MAPLRSLFILAPLALLAACGTPAPHNPADAAVLDRLLQPAGLTAPQLRDIGMAADLTYPDNKRAVAWDDGRIKVLSLQQAGLKSLPELSGLTGLEKLVLPGNALTELPDLSKLAALRHLDLSGNRLVALDPARLPPALESLDISGNPVADLAPLARLKTLRQLKARGIPATDIAPLLDLPLELADMQGCKIAALPARLPSSPAFRIDLKGCPVASPPGLLEEWRFSFSQGGAPGEVQTTQGLLLPGPFEVKGTWQSVPGMVAVSVPVSPNMQGVAAQPVQVEVAVQSGTLRLYLAAASDPRGPWYDKGFVTGFDGMVRKPIMAFADASPGKPARLAGNLSHPSPRDYQFVIEPQGGAKVTGLSYRVWR